MSWVEPFLDQVLALVPVVSGVDSAKSLSVGSSIAVATATSQTGDVSSTGLSSTATTIPTTLPRIISPNGGIPSQPNNSTLIQLGFTYGLNYPFVVNSSEAVAQIFSYLPPGVAYGLNIDQGEMVMQYLQPYNTISTLGYITTLAMAYIPAQMVDPLSLLLLNPNSALSALRIVRSTSGREPAAPNATLPLLM